MKDLQNFNKLSEKKQFQIIYKLVLDQPEKEQDYYAEKFLGMTLKEAKRIMEEL